MGAPAEQAAGDTTRVSAALRTTDAPDPVVSADVVEESVADTQPSDPPKKRLRRRRRAQAGAGESRSCRPAREPRERPSFFQRGWGRHQLRRLRQHWHRSLQFRTVVTATGLSTLILTVTLFGLSAQISQRLLDSKIAGAERDLTAARVIVEGQINSSDRSASDETRMASALAVLTAQGPQAGQLSANAGSYVPVLYIPEDGLHPPISTPSNLKIPASLAQFVSSNQVSYQYSDMNLGAGPTKVLIVGTPTSVDMPDLQLYLIYSLAGEERTLNLFNTTLVSGGAMIVILMGLLSYFLARQLVRPIRSAANTAQQFAAGDLNARMASYGEDDFARLATSFNEMAESLKTQIVQLEEFGSAQKRFTSDVSHELRTPLTTVRMAADIIYDHADELDPGTARASQLMVKELDKFESLLNDLLEISRHDAGVAELNSEKMDIRTCVYSALAAVSGVAASVDVSTEIEIPQESVIAEVDSRRVERILRNLLANAYDHCEGKPVTLTLRADENTVGISVRDRGVGLKAGEAQKVFDRFWRADPSRVRQSGGTGLGLAIATQDAELHGGRLEAWGVPGEGSCFRLTLPRTAGEKVTSSPVSLRFSIDDYGENDVEANATGEIPLSSEREMLTAVARESHELSNFSDFSQFVNDHTTEAYPAAGHAASTAERVTGTPAAQPSFARSQHDSAGGDELKHVDGATGTPSAGSAAAPAEDEHVPEVVSGQPAASGSSTAVTGSLPTITGPLPTVDDHSTSAGASASAEVVRHTRPLEGVAEVPEVTKNRKKGEEE